MGIHNGIFKNIIIIVIIIIIIKCLYSYMINITFVIMHGLYFIECILSSLKKEMNIFLL